MKSLNQLLLDFDYEQNFRDDDFYVGKSNFYTFELIHKWPKWEKNFLNIIGDRFSAKGSKKMYEHLADVTKSSSFAWKMDNCNAVSGSVYNNNNDTYDNKSERW